MGAENKERGATESELAAARARIEALVEVAKVVRAWGIARDARNEAEACYERDPDVGSAAVRTASARAQSVAFDRVAAVADRLARGVIP